MTIRLVIGILIGAGIGALMGYFGKCTSGMCPLTANPFRGAFFGALIGVLFVLSSGRGRTETAEPKQQKEAESEEALIHITSARAFEKVVLNVDLPCLVDFSSRRCPPCRILDPIVKKLAKKYKGQAMVCKVSLDHRETRGLPQRYGIRAIPTIIFFSKGKETQRLMGLRSEEAYINVLDEMIK